MIIIKAILKINPNAEVIIKGVIRGSRTSTK